MKDHTVMPKIQEFLLAAENDKHDTMRYLHSIDENLCKGKNEDGDTALTLASRFGSKETVELLIKEFNADIHELGFQGRNCFLSAASGDKHETMRFLHSIDGYLCKGKDKNGDTALTLASKFGSKETVELLIKEFNADIHELGFNHRNCFLCAAGGDKHETMRFLHSIDGNLCKGKDKNGVTALALATTGSSILICSLCTSNFSIFKCAA